MVALDIFTGKKLEDICPSTHNMEVPNVKRKDYQLIGMDDDYLSMMDDTGDTREDLKCPEDDVGQEIRTAIAKRGREIIIKYSVSSVAQLRKILVRLTKNLLYSGIRINFKTRKKRKQQRKSSWILP